MSVRLYSLLLLSSCAAPANWSGEDGEGFFRTGVHLNDNGESTAYVCGVGDQITPLTRWFSLNAQGHGEKDGWSYSWPINTTDGTLVDPNGVAHGFTVEAANSAVLFESIVDGCRSGAVITGDTLTGAYCSELLGGDQFEVLPRSVISPPLDRVQVQVIGLPQPLSLWLEALP